MQPAPPAPLIDFQGVSLRRSGRAILTGIDWRVEAGTHWAVVGANGSGKTTLLRIAAGMLFPSGGRAEVLGCVFGAADLALLRRRVGWVSSAAAEYISPSAPAAEIVAGGPAGAFSGVRPPGPEALAAAGAALARTGFAARAAAPWGVLSAGERAGVLLARALAGGPELLVLDEAAAGLDLAAREGFLRAVTNTAAGGAAVVMVTHHIEEIPACVTHALVLRDGRALAAGPVAEALTGPILSAAFGLPVSVRREGGRFAAAVTAANPK